MTWDYVTVDRQGLVAVVRFDRKGSLNASTRSSSAS
jgi:hypothetical protein